MAPGADPGAAAVSPARDLFLPACSLDQRPPYWMPRGIATSIAAIHRSRYSPTRGVAMSGCPGQPPGGWARGSPRRSRERLRCTRAHHDMSANRRTSARVRPRARALLRSADRARGSHVDQATRLRSAIRRSAARAPPRRSRSGSLATLREAAGARSCRRSISSREPGFVDLNAAALERTGPHRACRVPWSRPCRGCGAGRAGRTACSVPRRRAAECCTRAVCMRTAYIDHPECDIMYIGRVCSCSREAIRVAM
jgi:hypothetical protein